MTPQPIDDPSASSIAAPVEWLPYLLSLPALLVCVGILIPFVTALYYSTLRFRLNLPALKGFIWFGNYTNLLYDAEFWNTVSVSLRYTAITVGVELVLGSIIALLLQRQTAYQQHDLGPAAAAADDRAGDRVADVEADDQSEFRHPVLSRQPRRHLRLQVGVEPVHGAVHGRSGRCLGLHAVHHGAAAGRAALAAAAAVRGGRAGRRPAAVRVLPHHPADAVALHHHRRLFRLLDAIQQFDIVYAMTQGGPGNTLLVFQVQAYLEFFQYTNVGRSAALLMVLWAITYVLSNIFIKNGCACASAATRRRERG